MLPDIVVEAGADEEVDTTVVPLNADEGADAVEPEDPLPATNDEVEDIPPINNPPETSTEQPQAPNNPSSTTTTTFPCPQQCSRR